MEFVIISLDSSTCRSFNGCITCPYKKGTVTNMKCENPDQELEETIQSIFDEHNKNYGYRRIHLELKNLGIVVNHKKCQRLMQKQGLKGNKFTRKSVVIVRTKGISVQWRKTVFSAASILLTMSETDHGYYRIQVFGWSKTLS